MKHFIKLFVFFLIVLCLPFTSMAQWSVSLITGGGVASQTSVTPNYDGFGKSISAYSDVGFSFQAGVDVNYYFTSRIGFGTGLTYAHNRSPMNFEDNPTQAKDMYWHAESIKIPISINWALGKKRRSILQFGFDANINLRRHDYDPPAVNLKTYRDNPFFSGMHLGYNYMLGRHFHIGILLYRDITPFATRIFQKENGDHLPSQTRMLYFHTAQLTLSYQLWSSRK